MRKHYARVLAVCAVVGAITFGLLARKTRADVEDGPTIASLAGHWQLTMIGVTGCGNSAGIVYIDLGSNGVGTTTSRGHSSGCPDGAGSPSQFIVQSLSPNGSGTANLGCGTGCGWQLIIQVSKNGEMFNYVDVDPANPGNYVEGTAVKQF